MRNLLIVFVLIVASCSPKIKKIPSYPFDVIRVTRGGGFTGNVTGYAIDKNGEISNVYQLAGKPARQTFLRLTTPDSVKLVFDKVLSTGIHQVNHQVPGNMTYNIILQKDSIIHTISWAELNDSTQSYANLYQYLRSFASGKK